MAPSLIYRETGIAPERSSLFGENDLTNGVVVLRLMKPDKSIISVAGIHACYDMEAHIHELINCRTHFYNIFISAMNNALCAVNLCNVKIPTLQLAKALVENIEKSITPELYVPPQFYKLQSLVNDWYPSSDI